MRLLSVCSLYEQGTTVLQNRDAYAITRVLVLVSWPRARFVNSGNSHGRRFLATARKDFARQADKARTRVLLSSQINVSFYRTRGLRRGLLFRSCYSIRVSLFNALFSSHTRYSTINFDEIISLFDRLDIYICFICISFFLMRIYFAKVFDLHKSC